MFGGKGFVEKNLDQEEDKEGSLAGGETCRQLATGQLHKLCDPVK